MKADNSKEILTLPYNAGEEIVRTGAVLVCPLLGTNSFISYCRDRGITIDRARLLRLERLGMFAPVFRVRTPEQDIPSFNIPVRPDNDWFELECAWDTTGLSNNYDVPDESDRTLEGYYSSFQIEHLQVVLQRMTMRLNLDSFLEDDGKEVNWQEAAENWLQYGRSTMELLQAHEYRRSVGLLCQYISNRYYFKTQTDQRTYQVSGAHTYSDSWLTVLDLDWDWYKEVRQWDPNQVAKLFNLTPEKLKHAYQGWAHSLVNCDPIEPWYQLTQFVSVNERKKLKGDALRAETLRAGVYMLRLLYKDLYNKELEHPNEIYREIINPIPELEVRVDTRRHLEFVANRYGVNPQPKLCLFLEGESEETVVVNIFKKYFGSHPGNWGIEIIILRGVDNATGNKKDDRFRAILRLADYLHHQQTIAFLILDNENNAQKLKEEAKKARSLHSEQRYVTRYDYIKIWKDSFEFDNFSCTELASALSKVSKGHAHFTRDELLACKNQSNSGAALKKLFTLKTKYGLPKVELAKILVDIMLAPESRRKVDNRPITMVLFRVAKLASRNPFPIMHESWIRNQASTFLGKKRK